MLHSRNRSLYVVIASVLFIGHHTVAEEIQIGDRLLRVPDGFEVTLAASSELASRPIAVATDEQGRLYVTDSGGMSERAEKQLELLPHSIRRLEDTNGDGIFDRSTLFADRMMFPEGCMWYDGSLYVAAPPQIWKLTDVDDDGISDRREVWFDGRTVTGCGNDLHGPYRGLDGCFYWCKGAFAEQQHQLSDGTELITRSSHIFRAHPDGSHLETVLTGGMDNPVNVAFLGNGERFLSCTFFQHPADGRRDGLIHAIYGGVYGKRHPSIYAHPRTGDVMPVLCHQGAAAPCGLIAGSRSLWGGGYDQHLFACYFNLHRVVQHQLIPEGPGYRTEDIELISCDHPDFHPTDVFEDADGSLLVVDTGGWYKVCCPTSQLAKPDVPGAIYRIRKRGTAPVSDPRGQQLSWNDLTSETLAGRLSDPRSAVRRRATDGLRQQSAAAVPAITAQLRAEDAATRLEAVWTLAGIFHPEAGVAAVSALRDENQQVRQAAAHAVGLHRVSAALPDLLKMAAADSAGPARAAAEAIGRIGSREAVPALLQIIGDLRLGPVDETGAPAEAAARIQEHSLIYALMEIGDAESIREGMTISLVNAQRAALVALDQMPEGGTLEPDNVIDLLQHPSPAIHRTASWIISEHADWGRLTAERFRHDLFVGGGLLGQSSEQILTLLSSLSDSAEIRQLLADLSLCHSQSWQLGALSAMSNAELTETPTEWVGALASLAASADREIIAAVIRCAQSLPQQKERFQPLLMALGAAATNTDLSADLRIRALATAGPQESLSDATFSLLINHLPADRDPALRRLSATTLAAAKLSADQVAQLLDSLIMVGPMELPLLVPALQQHATSSQGYQLLTQLADTPGFSGLRTDQLQALLSAYSAEVQQQGRPLLVRLNADLEQQTAMLEDYLDTLPEGDVRRGHEVFMSRKAACNTCHRLGYGGGNLGPDLTRIGRVRNRRDLLEAILFPSASIVRGYEPVSLELESGLVVSGIITGETSDTVTVAMDAEKTMNLKRDSIAEAYPSAVSPMPAGIIKLLTVQELADLLAFLQTDER
jgi:putative membrane-bound dehydrogenase-like protein